MTDHTNIPLDRSTIQINRLQRKLAQRDARIAGLIRKVQLLEQTVSSKALYQEVLPRTIERAVQNALCNVRMIPVLGIGKDAKILDVKYSSKE